MLTRFSILVLDDDEDCLQWIADSLSAQYEVETASTLKTALTLLWQRDFDLVLVDPDLPLPTRKDVIDALHAHPAFDPTPILVCSDHPVVRRRVGEGRAHGFLDKPFSSDELKQAAAHTSASTRERGGRS